MKHLPNFLFCLLLTFCAQAQSDNKIVIGTNDSVYSKILNEPRNIWVHVPDSGPGGIFTQERYPVLYLLDGDAHFSSVVGMVQQLSSGGNDICPKMIVVGIPNTNRWRDLSPTHVKGGPYLDSAMVKTTGGGEAFLSFMEKELMPYIETKYPTEPYRMLIGHSLGGLLAVHSLIHHPTLFNAYVAIDPSMWWDNWKLEKETQKVLKERKFDGTSLYLGIANTMEGDMTIEKAKKDNSHSTEHIRSIFALDKMLSSNRQNQLKYRSKYYGDDTHGSVPLITEYDALRFIFDFYPMKLRGKDYSDTTSALAIRIKKVCALRSEKLGYTVKPPEELFNNLGYRALNEKRFAQAELYFKLNTDYYPNSFNVYDSFGDYFLEKGDIENAILNFKKSLAIKEMPYTKQKVEVLEAGKPNAKD
ncbi:MAG: alpha/beta hydrolase [Phycisphaerae bacterium]|nr:alpha/beta hydrolase [Saprospiraceae bacterium]